MMTNEKHYRYFLVMPGTSNGGKGERVLSEIVYDLLVVDDQAGVRRLLYEAFTDDGLQVAMASSGAEAVQKVSSSRVAMVLLDLKMPGMNGLQTLQEFYKLDAGLPVVMMTAYGELELMAEARKLGIRHYVTKPFDLQEVRYLVKALLAESRPRDKYAVKTG